MTTIYVRTTGNDTTGTGLTGAPYATLKKALSVAAAADVILMGDGTYAEDSGSGYLNITQSFSTTSRVLVSPEGQPGAVIIKGTTGTYGVVFGSATGIHFDAITFQAQASTVLSTIRFTGNSKNIHFSRCRFQVYSITGTTNTCVATAWNTSGWVPSNHTFSKCSFDQIGPYGAAGIVLDGSATGVTPSDMEVRDCDFNLGSFGIRMLGITNARVHGNTVDAWSALSSVHAFQLGVDGPTGATCSGFVTGNNFRTINGHAAVIGAGCNGVLVAGNRFYGGNNSGSGQGLVIKEAQNVRIERNLITSGYLSGLYFKAARDCQAFDNTVYNEHANSAALRIAVNPEDSAANQRLMVRRNYFHAVAGTVLSVGGASDDSGGSVIDENVYVATGTATLGSVRGSTVTTTSSLRAAWSGYDRAVNDRNSRIGQTRGTFAGTPFVDLPA